MPKLLPASDAGPVLAHYMYIYIFFLSIQSCHKNFEWKKWHISPQKQTCQTQFDQWIRIDMGINFSLRAIPIIHHLLSFRNEEFVVFFSKWKKKKSKMILWHFPINKPKDDHCNNTFPTITNGQCMIHMHPVMINIYIHLCHSYFYAIVHCSSKPSTICFT